MSWSCPSCNLPLHKYQVNWRCSQSHCFDVAKEGYVNLLLAQHKNSKQPGDNKQMVNARHAFLQQGYYQPLAQQMANLLNQHVSDERLSLLDAGCGEGYYLSYCQQSLQSNGREVEAKGIDISKFAVQKAAKLNKHAEFAVASCFSIPLYSDSLNAIIQVFAPSSEQEVARLLKPEGVWLTVNPAPNHLHQLKALLYQTPETHKDSAAPEQSWHQLDAQQVSFEFDLVSEQDREHLLMMTPYYWSATEQAKDKIKNQLERITADFQLNLFVKAE